MVGWTDRKRERGLRRGKWLEGRTEKGREGGGGGSGRMDGRTESSGNFIAGDCIFLHGENNNNYNAFLRINRTLGTNNHEQNQFEGLWVLCVCVCVLLMFFRILFFFFFFFNFQNTLFTFFFF